MRVFPILLLASAALCAAPVFTLSSNAVETYDYAEITVTGAPVAGNPFVDATLTGEFTRNGDAATIVTGFCDSPDGSLFRIRFLPAKPGPYQFTVRLQTPAGEATWAGSFTATASHRKGLVRVDADHPWHFVWEGTGEHYFWNGLTTYALMGWQSDDDIRAVIDRAARLKINRLRVTLNGPRVADATRWYEPLKPSAKFHFLFGPWLGAHPDNIHDPGWDVTRFDVDFWRKYERMLRYARDRDVAISVIFFLDGEDAGADPFGKANRFSAGEKRYYAYAAARLSAYSNVMWDVTNEWHLFRDAWWVERMGTLLKSLDPYRHLASCHGRGEFPWMLSSWADFAMFQLWDEDGGYAPMLKRRNAQQETGRPLPQVNEEYGYQDHYPVKWGGNRRPPARSADNRRRLAWQIAMAGCYQTTGERANLGQGDASPATPGGWINGGFDASMTMLEGYAHIVEFFTSMEYWKLEPAPGLAQADLLVLAEPGRQYVLYMAHGTGGEIQLPAGTYRARWYNPRAGIWSAQPQQVDAKQGRWAVPAAPDAEDWLLVLDQSLYADLMPRKINRREWGAALAAIPVALQAQANTAPQPAADDLSVARQHRQESGKALEDFPIPMATEPAFQFKP